MQNVSGTSAMPPDSTNAVVNVIKQVQNNLIKGVKQIPSANGTKFAAPAAGSWRKLPSSSGESKANSSCPYRPTPIDQLGKTKEKAETAGTTEEYTPEAKPLKQQSKPLSTLKTGAAGLKQKADSSTDVTKKSPTTTTTARLTTKPPGKTEVGVKRSFNPEKDSVPPKRKIAEMQKNDRVIDTLRADLLTKAVKQQSKGSGLLTKSKVASTDASLRPPVSQPISSSQSIIDMSDIFGEDSDAEVKEDPVRSQAQKPNKIDSKLKNTAINRSKSSGTLVNKTKPAGIGTAKVPISKPNPLLNGFALTSPTAELDMDSLMDDNNFQFGLDEDLPKTPSPDLDETVSLIVDDIRAKFLTQKLKISSTTSTMPIRVSGDKTTGKIRVAYKSAANDTVRCRCCNVYCDRY